MTVDNLTAAAIIRDVANGVEPGNSKLAYNKGMMQYRKEIEEEWEAARKLYPNAKLEVPNDIDGL